ncbi:Pentatricopeptide repeat [Trema orientale]|uniref:Pentatricopeptide repeat n=1 Tax=Trema orientale TaxID=63057 RepID=A0A2P5DWJ6_TREOI|nr:Pentatricopeptide repeat [Trema orientale]
MTNKDLVSWNTMTTGYAHTGQMDKALEIFDVMGKRNIVSWNSMIADFLQNGLYLKMFLTMRKEGRRCIQSTFSCGKEQLNHLKLKSDYVNDLFVSNTLITMYAKSGRVVNAELVSRDIANVDIVYWNSLITGYALNGYGKEAVTFVGVLSAYSHAWLVAQGLKLFKSMTQIYKIEPLPEHYACMVDLLS